MDNSVELAELEALLRSMGVKDVEPRVVSQLLERLRRYTASLLYDGRDYANHAGRDKIEVADVRLAAQERKFGQVTDVPQRGELALLAEEINRQPLPLVPDTFGVRLPPKEFQLTNPLFDIVPGSEVLPTGQSAADASADGALRASGEKSVRSRKGAAKQLVIADLQGIKINNPTT